MIELEGVHAATLALREALVVKLGDLFPPYAHEVLLDLQEATEQSKPDPAKIRALVSEAESVMEMLPSMPPEWEPLNQAARAAGLVPAK